jgi:hypothetical protein
MHQQLESGLLDQFARRWWPGQLAAQMITAEPYADDTFTLEGHELRIIEQGRTDTVDTTSLHVPSIDLVVGGDVLYNQCHMFVGDTTPESRRNWIDALDRLAALRPRIAIAGHRKPVQPTRRRRSRTASATSRTSAGCSRARQPTKNCSTK